jgi:hypothetical protein
MNTNIITVDSSLLTSVKSNKRQVQAILLCLYDYTDKGLALSDAVKLARYKATLRVGADVLKRKATLVAKTPGELRQYVEGISQKATSTIASLPSSTWLLDFAARTTVKHELQLTIDLCAQFVREYEAARTDAEKQALKVKQEANTRTATLDAQANASLMVKKAS